MPESKENPADILKEVLNLVKQVEDKVIRLKDRSSDLEINQNIKGTLETVQNEFIEHIYDLIDYWHDLPGKSLRERMEGLIFSVLVTFDGESGGMPPYAVKPIDENGNEGEDIGGYLHELFSSECSKRREG